MAIVVSNVTDDTCKVAVSGLSAYSAYWARCFVRLNSDTSDTTYDNWKNVSGSDTTSWAVSGLSPSTKYIANVAYASGIDSAGNHAWQWPFTAQTFTTEAAAQYPLWPGNFSWTSVGSPGTTIRMPAHEWNFFAGLVIDAVYLATGRTYVQSTPAVTGQPMKATTAEEIANALRFATSSETNPPHVYSGNPISASYFNSLATAYNKLRTLYNWRFS